MLKDFCGLASMIRAGMALASHIKKKGGQRGLQFSPPGSIEGLTGSSHVLLTGPTEPWPRKKTYALTLADPTLYQVLPAVPCHRAERDPGYGAQVEPPVLLPGTCGHTRGESGHGPPRLPTPACRPPPRQHPAAPRRGQSRLTSQAPEGRQCGS
jgi:hypothetical protein